MQITSLKYIVDICIFGCASESTLYMGMFGSGSENNLYMWIFGSVSENN